MRIHRALLPFLLAFLSGPGRAEEAADSIPRNLGATFSEEPDVDAAIESSLLAMLDAVQRQELSGPAFAADDAADHRFFYRALARLVGGGEGRLPTLLKAFPVGDGTVLLTLAFGAWDAERMSLEALVELEARPTGDTYAFACVFGRRTAPMHRTTLGAVTFVHAGELDRASAEGFARFRADFVRSAEKSAAPPPLEYVCFGGLDPLLKAYGLVFDARRCNFLEHDLGFLDGAGRRFVTGTGDPNRRFEFVREHLARAPGSETLFGPFATGLAVCYGGYGLSGDDLQTLKAQFRAKLRAEPDVDFLAEFRKGRRSSVQRHFSHFVISAFLADRALREHGLETALRLARSGPDAGTFFAELKEVLGVTEENFHRTVVDLIRS